MEEKPCFVPKLSLKDIALRRVVINFWNQPDVLSSIAKIRFKKLNYSRSRNAFRQAVEGKVKDKISKLGLPESLKKQVMSLIEPIGSEIRAWKRYHEKYLSDLSEDFHVSVLEKLYWTAAGTIDFRKTAIELVSCEMLDIVNRYKLACMYCLEDYIPSFWEQLPEEVKSTFYNKEDTSHIRQPYLPFFWPYMLKGEESKIDSMPGRVPNLSTFHQYAFENTARKGNKAAAEYFFQKLTQAEREDCLIRTADRVVMLRNLEQYENPEISPMEKHSEVLCYLLSLMTPEQQMEVLKQRPHHFLRCFLDWPLHDYFVEMVGLVWTFLTVVDYDPLLQNLSLAVMKAGYFIPKLFQEFYIHSPVNFKKYFVHRAREFVDFFTIFCNNQDSETIQVIFRNVDVDDRVKMVSSYKFFNILDDLIMEDGWNFAELCLREATLSKKDRKNLKKTFMKFLAEDDKLPIEGTKWERFFQLLDKIDESASNKRSSEDEKLTNAKKLCCDD